MKETFRDRFDRPIFIVSTPRSGSTLMFETLAQAPHLFSIGGESHGLIERFPELSPVAHQSMSNLLTAEDAKNHLAERLAQDFYEALRDRQGSPANGRVRMLEKTPKNALRVSFFDAIWPDACFIYLYRDPRQTLSSMIEAWSSGRFRTYPRLPGWNGPQWSLLLVPGWQRLNGMPIHRIVAHQWAITTGVLLDALEAIPAKRVQVVRYEDFLARPQDAIKTIAGRLDFEWDRQLTNTLPLSRYTVSRPNPDKWRSIQTQIDSVFPIVEQVDARARRFTTSRSM
jgi:hypothetical protein